MHAATFISVCMYSYIAIVYVYMHVASCSYSLCAELG